MSEPRGRRLVAGTPEERVEIHNEAWPEALLSYQEIFAKVLGRVLRGEPDIDFGPTTAEGPTKLHVGGLTDSDRELLDQRLPIPPTPNAHRPAAGSIKTWAIDLPRTVRLDPRFSRTWASSSSSYILFDNGATMLAASVIGPVMDDLAGVFRLRSGEGPQTLKGRKNVLDRSIETHEMLGLDAAPLRRFLDPTLTNSEVVAARKVIIETWAEHPPDVGERAMALLCSKLGSRYYSKAKKDGTARLGQVITASFAPLLHITLDSWDELLAYLEEAPDEPVTQGLPTTAPIDVKQLPTEVADRTNFAEVWCLEVFDRAHAEQEPGDPYLDGLVPFWFVTSFEEEQPWDAEGEELEQTSRGSEVEGRSRRPDDDRTSSEERATEAALPAHRSEPSEPERPTTRFQPDLWRMRTPANLIDKIWDLWGKTVFKRYPKVLVDELHPETQLAKLVRPATSVWETISLTCWRHCFGDPGLPIQGLEEYLEGQLDTVAEAGHPIDRSIFTDLIEVGKEHDWLLHEPRFSMTIGFGSGEDDDVPKRVGEMEVFRQLRDIATHHRRAWFDDHLAPFLKDAAKDDLTAAIVDYEALSEARGRPPTLKGAYPKMHEVAKLWFGGDISKLAESLGVEGPVADSIVVRSQRSLPGDMPNLARMVATKLGGTMDLDRDDENYWPARRRYELAQAVEYVLALWQASGELPSRPAFDDKYRFLLRETFKDDFEAGYLEYIEAIRGALADTGHSAASAPLAN